MNTNTGARPPSPLRWRTRAVNMMLLGVALATSLAVAEVTLRVLDPLPFRVRGTTLRLSTNTRVRLINKRNPRLDPELLVTRNGLGFRGPGWPSPDESHFTLFTVGGSTTECYYLADGNTWPDQMATRLRADFPALWVNNAGLDGHSTFGHLFLVEQLLVPLKPDVIVFLTGINDVGAEQQQIYDKRSFQDCEECTVIQKMTRAATENSVLVSTLVNLRRALRAHSSGVSHANVDLRTQPRWEGRSEDLKAIRTRHAVPLRGYRQRLDSLVLLCRRNGITPVLMTQPALVGFGVEPVTGIELSTLVSHDSQQSSGTAWTVLEWYNNVVRGIGRDAGVPVIDLANELPKDSTYFYDFFHYTNAGAEKIGQIVARHMTGHLRTLTGNRTERDSAGPHSVP